MSPPSINELLGGVYDGNAMLCRKRGNKLPICLGYSFRSHRNGIDLPGISLHESWPKVFGLTHVEHQYLDLEGARSVFSRPTRR